MQAPGNETIERLSQTGRRTQRAALIAAATLLTGFIVVFAVRTYQGHELATATKETADAPATVDVATVKAAAANSLLSLPGETAAWYSATIYARVDGYVGTWSADIGDHVQAGQLLATIETPDLDAELNASQAKLKAAIADVNVHMAEAGFAESTYRRWSDAPKGVVSQQEREDKEAGYKSAQARLVAAQAQVKLAQSEVDRLTALEAFKRVVAPFTGTITERRIDIGNLVTAGSTAATMPLYRMVQDDPIRVFVNVPQDAASAIVVGETTDITTNGTNPRHYTGKVTRTADAIDPQSRTLRVEIDLPNHDNALVPGLYVQVAFREESVGVGQVPAAALMLRAAGPEVAVLSGDHVEFHSVTIAEDDGTLVELGSGVIPGDKVILNINSQIADGDKVQVSQTDGQLAAAGPGPAAE